jgi:hypothetical protein
VATLLRQTCDRILSTDCCYQDMLLIFIEILGIRLPGISCRSMIEEDLLSVPVPVECDLFRFARRIERPRSPLGALGGSSSRTESDARAQGPATPLPSLKTSRRRVQSFPAMPSCVVDSSLYQQSIAVAPLAVPAGAMRIQARSSGEDYNLSASLVLLHHAMGLYDFVYVEGHANLNVQRARRNLLG